MKISLLTDAPKHNLALMKLSAWHKQQGDSVLLNMPLWSSDYRYASVLFEWSKISADEYGGPGFSGNVCLPKEIESQKPDYELFNIDYSLGYTFRPCYQGCEFCKVPKMEHPDTNHHSIYEFHNPLFNKICILNNNTFLDPKWKDTFQEIWDYDLTVIDENGYDLRLLDDEKADALHKTKFGTPIHFAWDRMGDEHLIKNGLELLSKHHLRSTSNCVYVLIGYNTTEAEDLHRCQIINDYGLTPYPMPYIKTDYTKRFKRFINLHFYRTYPTIEKAWMDYKG